MKKTKIGKGYFRSGHSRTTERKATIWLIDGFAYAKDKSTAECQMAPMQGEMSDYVRVNKLGNTFHQVSNHTEKDQHKPIQNL